MNKAKRMEIVEGLGTLKQELEDTGNVRHLLTLGGAMSLIEDNLIHPGYECNKCHGTGRLPAGPDDYTGKGYTPKRLQRYQYIYRKAVEFILEDRTYDVPIVELGCGVGEIARILLEKGIDQYIGMDFSPTMTKLATGNVPSANFMTLDVRGYRARTVFEQNCYFIATEVLEHILEDLDVIRSLPIGSCFVFSVPRFDSKYHVRTFPSKSAIYSRYKGLLHITKIAKRRGVFICKSFRRNQE